ncbi:MAG: M23 family metallopeptidase [Balneolaceae bacterium]|nr:MAG: M23 family metallopeptidase [Balneolaceae bacterium]
MAFKRHYIYDPERCEFVPLEYDSKKKLIHSLSFWLINSIVLACFGLALLSNVVGTPAEIALKDENKTLLHQLKKAEVSILDIEKQLNVIAKLDNEMYRSVLGLEPISEDVRMAGTGGADIYSDFDFHSQEASEILRRTASKLDKLERQVNGQMHSFDEIKNYYNSNKNRLRNIPAIKPVNGIILSGYGMRPHPVLGYRRMHEGVDFRADVGTEVYATGDGVIKFAGRRGTYGNLLEIDHGFGMVTRYAHLSGFAEGIRPGRKVERGEIIAFSGNSGLTQGPHLHYEVIVDGKPADPVTYLIADITPEEYLMFKEMHNQSSEFSISFLD